MKTLTEEYEEFRKRFPHTDQEVAFMAGIFRGVERVESHYANNSEVQARRNMFEDRQEAEQRFMKYRADVCANCSAWSPMEGDILVGYCSVFDKNTKDIHGAQCTAFNQKEN